jgi:glycosyltransferase involved in cell wall biosynthesis
VSGLVTVITATWGRPKTVLEHAVASVASQDYPDIEHIVVTDGYSPALYEVLSSHGYSDKPGSRKRLVCLGRNWTGFSGDGGQGAIPRLVGSYTACGDYITYLDDDNDYQPHRISAMVKAIEDTGADVVFTAFLMEGRHMGTAPPTLGHVDASSFLHRPSLLNVSTWRPEGYECDWYLVERWLAAGVKWHYLEDPSLIHTGNRRGSPE